MKIVRRNRMVICAALFCAAFSSVRAAENPPFFDPTVRTESFLTFINVQGGVEYTLSFDLQNLGWSASNPQLFTVSTFGFSVYGAPMTPFGFITITIPLGIAGFNFPNELAFSLFTDPGANPYTYRNIWFRAAGQTTATPESFSGLWLLLPAAFLFAWRRSLGAHAR